MTDQGLAAFAWETRMRRLWLVLVAFSVPLPVSAQVSTRPPIPAPVVTLTGGIGNPMGWFGFQAERYFADGRVSAFGGLGYTPSIQTYQPSGPTFAAGFRGYTPGRKHRGFAEAAACQVAVLSDPFDPKQLYGPCLQLGYQFATRGGFTIVTSAGWGFSLGVPKDYGSANGLLLGLGFGYTWRKH
jgi:hypothetical protein